jgi:hypothetical protein
MVESPFVAAGHPDIGQYRGEPCCSPDKAQTRPSPRRSQKNCNFARAIGR